MGDIDVYLDEPGGASVAMGLSISDNEFIFYYVEISAEYTIWIQYYDRINLNYSLHFHFIIGVILWINQLFFLIIEG